MKYSDFVDLYEELEKTTKKLEKVEILSKFLIKLSKSGEIEWIYLLRGKVTPDYDEREFGISNQLIIKAIAKNSGVSSEEVVKQFRKSGDLGFVAEKLIGKKKQKSLFTSRLNVNKVFSNLKKLMDLEGKGSQEKKINLISELLVDSRDKEACYIVRTILGQLRIGVADAILRDAIGRAFFKEDVRKEIEQAYDRVNDFAEVFELSIKGIKYLEKVEIGVGRPINVMLPVKVENLDEAFRICGTPLAVEHKYDGFRVVIHNDGEKIKLFTRRLEEVTKQFPDVVEVVSKYVKAKTYVLDSEVVGFDPKTKKYKPFEAISQRIRRKHEVGKLINELPVEINVFDVLYLNGENVMDKPFRDRRKILEKIVTPLHFKIRLSTQFISNNKEEVRKFYEDALRLGEEGVMLKNLESSYHPGRRVGHMVKLKPVVNDLDLVITGAEYGTGKRAGGLTSFYVACKDGNEFKEVGKVSSGLKEKESEKEGTTYKEMDLLLKPGIIKEKGIKVWTKPKVVVSVTYQNVQKSPTYSSGFALRFPRITHHRPDRNVTDIATLKEIEKEAKKGR